MSTLLYAPQSSNSLHDGAKDISVFMVPDFRVGDVATLFGDGAHLLAYVQTMQHILNQGSPAVFVDGGNSFSPYMVAELARHSGSDPKEALKMIYVSRAFTAHQMSSLVMERLEPFVEAIRANFVLISDIASLFFHGDIPDSEAKRFFLGACMKLSDIATKKS